MMNEFSATKVKEILIEFKKLGGQRIDITGGEPTLRKDLKEIIEIAKSFNLKVELVTNGSLLSKVKLKAFKELGLDAIAVSLDGSIYETYAKIRPINRDTFNKIIDNIKQSIELGFYTKINTVVFRSNFKDLINITKLAIKLKANEHGLYYFSPIGRGKDQNKEVVNPLSWLKLLRQDFLKLDDKIKISVEVPIIEKEIAKRLETSCYLENPWHLQILPDGNVYPCAIMAAYKKPFGNLHKQSLKQLWEDKRLWEGEFYQRQIESLFQKVGGCVNYPMFSELLKNGYEFVCLCRKFSIKEVCNHVQEKKKQRNIDRL